MRRPFPARPPECESIGVQTGIISTHRDLLRRQKTSPRREGHVRDRATEAKGAWGSGERQNDVAGEQCTDRVGAGTGVEHLGEEPGFLSKRRGPLKAARFDAPVIRL